MAKRFEMMVSMDKRFEVVVPRKFSLVCFRLKPRFDGDDASSINQRLLEMVNSSGRAFMTHAKVDGMFVLRFAIGTTLTEMRHVEMTWKLIQAKAEDILLEDV
ncbi:Tyrosine decarboxylase [Rhynchospora pubera]|uniref:Tyrosine decarboxylase n=1 Tax=Rhynchospora pubera TaxID=906938 RepID=A0AAV8HI15_9POAL|nr:Tyrosine decarboxylase [Rhynchospora pubera]